MRLIQICINGVLKLLLINKVLMSDTYPFVDKSFKNRARLIF